MISEESILQTLSEVVKDIRSGNLEDAARQLRNWEFERLLKPIKDDIVGSPIRFRDPATLLRLDTERVHETGDYVRACQIALSEGDSQRALETAEAALERWLTPKAGKKGE